MQKEIEAKFCDVDIHDIRIRLEKAGAVCNQPMRTMRRALVETPDMKEDSAFLRLRDEGDKITLTYKKFHHGNGAHSASEHELTVNDFDTAKTLVEACGMKFHTYQESRRETWELDGVEVVIDEWPWMPPYIEIEAENEEAVRTIAQRLGFKWDQAVFGGADRIYEMLYDFSDGVRGVIDIPEVKFNSPLPEQFSLRKTA